MGRDNQKPAARLEYPAYVDKTPVDFGPKVDGYDKVKSRTTNGPDYNLTNKHTPETVDVKGEKTWDDANNQDGKRPKSITVKLIKQVENGQPVEVQRTNPRSEKSERVNP